MPYALVYAPEVADHLAAIESKFHSLIRLTIAEQLTHEPTVETRNRKPLRIPAPLLAEWEIRFGPDNRFRVLYTVDEDALAVMILAIGEKIGNRLLIGGEDAI
jgi:mRNA-degrading endonuclease RelE of RelBE toxin-antitoxin system